MARDPIDVTRAIVICLALVGATLSPLVRDPADDGFPLSTYPMFAYPRPTLQSIDYAIGETARGERRAITPAMVGTHEVLQARAVFERAVGGGHAALFALCREIAARAPDDVAVVKIVRGTHDAVEYLVDHRLGREDEYVRCRK